MAGRSAWPGSLGVWTALWRRFVTLRIRPGVRIRVRPPPILGADISKSVMAKVFSYVAESNYFSHDSGGRGQLPASALTASALLEKSADTGSCDRAFKPATTHSALNSAPALLV